MSNLEIHTRMAGALAVRLNMKEVDGQDLMYTLRSTILPSNMDDAQIVAFLGVATQYGLSPWTKEIYAFPDKNGKVVPVVGVDGWSRIINENPHFNGVDFDESPEHCTCTIWRKDREHPTRVTEYMDECYREQKQGKPKGPWQTHPRRMLRHKALIQCARLAFGFVGIHDADEAERIVESEPRDMGMAEVVTPEPARQGPDAYPADKFETRLPKWTADVLGKPDLSEALKCAVTYIEGLGCTPEQVARLVKAVKEGCDKKSQVTDVEAKQAEAA